MAEAGYEDGFPVDIWVDNTGGYADYRADVAAERQRRC